MFQIFVDRKYHSARKWSNRVLRVVAPVFSGEIANVSGWDDRDKEGGCYKDYFAGQVNYTLTNFSGYSGFSDRQGEIELDLTADLPKSLLGRFDVVYNHTTLEHIFEVRKAFANLCAMTRDVVIVVVPFSQVQHESESYGDFWRFTPTCMRELFAENGLDVVYEAESPQQNAAIYLLFVASRHPESYLGKLPDYEKIRLAGSWMGASLWVSGIQYLRNRTRKLLARVKGQ